MQLELRNKLKELTHAIVQYENLEDGGWIEQIEPDCRVMCDDGSLPSDSYAAGMCMRTETKSSLEHHAR